MAFAFIFQSFNVINNLFQAKVLSKYPIIASLLIVFLLSILKLIIIFLQKGIIYFAFLNLLEAIMYACSFIFLYVKSNYKVINWKYNKHIAKQIFLDSWPLLFASAFALIYTRIDQVMVKNFIDQTAVGFYDVAVRIAEVWYFIPTIIVSSIFPAIINAKKNNLLLYKKRLQDLIIIIFTITFLISLPIFIFAKPIINLLFGFAYHPAIIVLQIYVWAGIGLSIANVINQYLIIENYTKILFFSSCIGMIINVILNFIFIPIYGINGAAFSTLISYFTIPLSIILLLRGNLWKNVS